MKKKLTTTYLIEKRISFLLLILSFALLNQLSAQKTFHLVIGGVGNDQANSVKQTTDGGYIATGAIDSLGAGGNDLYLVKTDSVGKVEWTKMYGGKGDDQGESVIQARDGGYVAAGYSNSFDKQGYDDYYVVKTNSKGDTLWTRTYGQGGQEQANSIQETSDGGYIVAGTSNNVGGMTEKEYFYLIRIDSLGGLIWSKTYNLTGTGLGAFDNCYAVVQSKDGGFVIAGSSSNLSMGTNYDLYLIKTRANGDTLWTRNIGGLKQEEAFALNQTADAGYILTGYSHGFAPSGLFNLYMVKTDSAGKPMWAKAFGASGFSNNRGHSVQQTKDHGYVIAGYTNINGTADAYLLKTDSTGALLWSKAIGGSGGEQANSVQETRDGGYIIAGYTSSSGAGGNDFYLIKTDANGNSECNTQSIATVESDATSGTFVYQYAAVVTSGASVWKIPSIVGTGGTVSNPCSTTTGIEEKSLSSSLNIFPNPTNGEFDVQLTLPLKGNLTFKLMDMQGRLIYMETKNQLPGFYETKIDLSNQAKEIYLLQIITDNETITKKVVVN